MQSYGIEIVGRDLERAPLADERLRQRVAKIGAAVARWPTRGLPQLLSESELEGAYRFVNNPRVTMEAIIAGHRQATLERCAAHKQVLAIHDTTAFAFSGTEPIEGLGLDNKGRGFSAHFGLLASADGERRPLGVVSVEPMFRYKRHDSERQRKKRFFAKDKESLRWLRMVDHIEENCGEQVDIVHVMDSEADYYDLIELLHRREHRFVIRMTHDRPVIGSRGERLESTPTELLERVQAVAEREVQLSRRTGKNKAPNSRKAHGPRLARTAKLEIAARRVRIARPTASSAPSDSLALHLVHVREVETPSNCEPIEWMLATTEPIHDETQVLAIVDYYRARWLIEEFFKTLKSGCAYEKRQFESKHALLNMLALSIPVACMILALRTAVRHSSQAPASRLLSPQQLQVLRAAIRTRSTSAILPAHPSENDVAYAIARLGGYRKRKHPPGWQSIAWGYQDLLLLEAGWALAQQHA